MLLFPPWLAPPLFGRGGREFEVGVTGWNTELGPDLGRRGGVLRIAGMDFARGGATPDDVVCWFGSVEVREGAADD